MGVIGNEKSILAGTTCEDFRCLERRRVQGSRILVFHDPGIGIIRGRKRIVAIPAGCSSVHRFCHCRL